jgi:hypothetical protein
MIVVVSLRLLYLRFLQVLRLVLLLGCRRSSTKDICECCWGAPGWRTSRLGAGDRGVTRKKSGRFACPHLDPSATVAGTGLAHQLA